MVLKDLDDMIRVMDVDAMEFHSYECSCITYNELVPNF
jgi:hypothetical protein